MEKYYEIYIYTVIYEEILRGMTETASNSTLPEVQRLPSECTQGTNITELLDYNLNELYGLMDRYKNHTVDVLPMALDKLKKNLVEADERAAAAL